MRGQCPSHLLLQGHGTGWLLTIFHGHGSYDEDGNRTSLHGSQQLVTPRDLMPSLATRTHHEIPLLGVTVGSLGGRLSV